MSVEVHPKALQHLFIDFDGTLVDSVPLLYQNYLMFLKSYGHAGNLKEFEALMGPSIEEFIPLLKQSYHLPKNLHTLTMEYTQGLAARYQTEAKLMTGAQIFLDLALSLPFQMTLVTSSSYSLIEGSLDELQLKKYFSHIVTGDQVKKTKPDPEIYLLALHVCEALPENSIAIEDSFNGISAALGASLPTIALLNQHLSEIPPQAMTVNSWPTLTQLFRSAYEK